MTTIKNLLLLGLLSTIYACSHPIEIVGEGDVLSATGTRNCYLEDYQASKENCTKNTVIGAYSETYFAEPRSGWDFARWVNYCTDATSNECAFAIPADAVQKNWGATVPALVAVFKLAPAITPPFPESDIDGNVSFDTANSMTDVGTYQTTVSSTQDADFFKFAASETAYYSVSLEFSNPDIYLYLYNDDEYKTLAGESRNKGAVSQHIDQKQLQEGSTYYVGVQAIAQSQLQNYRLTLEREPIPEPEPAYDIKLTPVHTVSFWRWGRQQSLYDQGENILMDTVYGEYESFVSGFDGAHGYAVHASAGTGFHTLGESGHVRYFIDFAGYSRWESGYPDVTYGWGSTSSVAVAKFVIPNTKESRTTVNAVLNITNEGRHDAMVAIIHPSHWSMDLLKPENIENEGWQPLYCRYDVRSNGCEGFNQIDGGVVVPYSLPPGEEYYIIAYLKASVSYSEPESLLDNSKIYLETLLPQIQ